MILLCHVFSFFFFLCRSETKYTDLVKESQIVVQTEDINDKD